MSRLPITPFVEKAVFMAQTQLRVRYAETDQMGVVYYGNYATYCEVGRVESIRQLGYTYKQMEAEGVMMPVVRMEIDYLRSARYDELLTIRSAVMPYTEGTQAIEFHQEIFNEAGKLITKAVVHLVFVNSHDFRKTTMPEALDALLRREYGDRG